MPSWLKWVWVSALGLFLSCAACLSYLIYAIRNDSPSKPVTGQNITQDMRRDAEQTLGIRFPASARLDVYWFAQGKDANLDVKLALPKADLSQLLSQTPLSSAVWAKGGEADYTMGPAIPEWRPNSVKRFRRTHIELPGGCFLGALLDDKPGREETVYLSWGEY